MTRFIDLLRTGLEPAAEHELASQQLPVLVARANLHWWRPDNAVPHSGKRLLLGVSTWSGCDMRLLDLVAGAQSRSRSGIDRIDVFNLGDCSRQEDFADYVPGIGHVLQTPVVGIWEDGDLKERATGKRARDLVAQLCGFDDTTDVVQWLNTAWHSFR